MSANWHMPKPKQGDVVLYSNDMHNFTNPVIAWVMKPPGDSTVQLLTFTEHSGFVVRPSVHHKDDPGIREANGWDNLGAWDFPPSAKPAEPSHNSEASRTGRWR